MKEAQIAYLRSGRVVSCGCVKTGFRYTARSHKIINLTGQRFGRLVVLREAGRENENVTWECRCDCGRSAVIRSRCLREGWTQSCGCLARELTATRNFQHGQSRTVEHNIWCGMKSRCFYERNPAFRYYGGRGITVCDRWLGHDGFVNFYADMGPRPSPVHSIDRIDVNGNYEPGNCRWATPAVQGKNKRNNQNLTMNGKTRTITDWARTTGITRDAIRQRLNMGWSVEDALTKPTAVARVYSFQGKRRTLKQWSKHLSIPLTVIYARIEQCGWSVKKALATPYVKQSRRASRSQPQCFQTCTPEN